MIQVPMRTTGTTVQLNELSSIMEEAYEKQAKKEIHYTQKHTHIHRQHARVQTNLHCFITSILLDC